MSVGKLNVIAGSLNWLVGPSKQGVVIYGSSNQFDAFRRSTLDTNELASFAILAKADGTRPALSPSMNHVHYQREGLNNETTRTFAELGLGQFYIMLCTARVLTRPD